MNTPPVVIAHPKYGRGTMRRLLETPGHAGVTFDRDDGTERRVLVRDLVPETLAERADRNDRGIADMTGHDLRAVARCLRESA